MQEMLKYPYVSAVKDRFVVLVENYVMLVHNFHLNIDYNQVEKEQMSIVVNIVRRFVHRNV
mgnify:CR=1 FL=1